MPCVERDEIAPSCTPPRARRPCPGSRREREMEEDADEEKTKREISWKAQRCAPRRMRARRPRTATCRPLTFKEIFRSLRPALLRLECQTAGFFFFRSRSFGFFRSFSTSPTGSPVEAFSTSPPFVDRDLGEEPVRDDRARPRLGDVLVGREVVAVLDEEPRGLRRPPQPFVRTRTHEPFSFSPVERELEVALLRAPRRRRATPASTCRGPRP